MTCLNSFLLQENDSYSLPRRILWQKCSSIRRWALGCRRPNYTWFIVIEKNRTNLVFQKARIIDNISSMQYAYRYAKHKQECDFIMFLKMIRGWSNWFLAWSLQTRKNLVDLYWVTKNNSLRYILFKQKVYRNCENMKFTLIVDLSYGIV